MVFLIVVELVRKRKNDRCIKTERMEEPFHLLHNFFFCFLSLLSIICLFKAIYVYNFLLNN